MEKMTYHCRVEREERVRHIIEEVGLGSIVKERFNYSPARGEGTFTCITNTGVTIIKNEDKTKIVTMYITTYRELVAIYNGPNKIPAALRKKVDRNQIKYINKGKTRFS